MNILKKYNSKKGTSTVEAVIILPLLVMLTFGGLKYGLLFLRAQQVTNVARQACRLAIRPYTTKLEVDAEIDRMMSAIGFSLANEDYVAKTEPEDIALAPDAMGTGDELTLIISYKTDSVDNLTLVNWLPLPDELVAQVSMSKEGP